MTWKLQAITGEFTGQEISVERDMLVGRHQDAEILLQSTDISRKHAALLFRDDHIWVKDLKSTNGTFVNGERVEQEQEIELHDGDMLQFASFMFMILAPERYKAHLPEIDVEPVTTVPHDQGMPSIAERAAETRIHVMACHNRFPYQNLHQYQKMCKLRRLLSQSLCLCKSQSPVWLRKKSSRKMLQLA